MDGLKNELAPLCLVARKDLRIASSAGSSVLTSNGAFKKSRAADGIIYREDLDLPASLTALGKRKGEAPRGYWHNA
jgi:hypothetical protein